MLGKEHLQTAHSNKVTEGCVLPLSKFCTLTASANICTVGDIPVLRRLPVTHSQAWNVFCSALLLSFQASWIQTTQTCVCVVLLLFIDSEVGGQRPNPDHML